MGKTEKLLGIVADSSRMPGWNDGLSMMIEAVDKKSNIQALSEEELSQVAGGVPDSDKILIDKLIKGFSFR